MILHKTIIGALHLAPLLGYLDCPGVDTIIDLALADLQAFQDGGVHAVIFENNYDLPHSEKISIENYKLMLRVGVALKRQAKVPLGVNVLWNDYQSALQLAKELKLAFIRVPVLVDDVVTNYGSFHAPMNKVAQYRTKIGAHNVKIYADIHVKHSRIISNYTLVESAERAIKAGADALIITGNWTGDSPDLHDLVSARDRMGDFPIIVGSGASAENINTLFETADAAIISTSLKEGGSDVSLTNLSEWTQRISATKTRKLLSVIN